MTLAKNIRRLILYLPLAILVVFLVVMEFQQDRVDKALREVDGLVWGGDGNTLEVHADTTGDGNITTHSISIVDRYGIEVYRTRAVIVQNLYGSGFVTAMQADDDPAMEIVIWGSNVRDGGSFYLDYSYGRVRKLPFSEADDRVSEFSRAFHRAHVEMPFIFLILLIATPAYYLLYYLLRILGRPFRKRRTEESGHV